VPARHGGGFQQGAGGESDAKICPAQKLKQRFVLRCRAIPDRNSEKSSALLRGCNLRTIRASGATIRQAANAALSAASTVAERSRPSQRSPAGGDRRCRLGRGGSAMNTTVGAVAPRRSDRREYFECPQKLGVTRYDQLVVLYSQLAQSRRTHLIRNNDQCGQKRNRRVGRSAKAPVQASRRRPQYNDGIRTFLPGQSGRARGSRDCCPYRRQSHDAAFNVLRFQPNGWDSLALEVRSRNSAGVDAATQSMPVKASRSH